MKKENYILHPFRILKQNRVYCVWLIYIFFASISIIIKCTQKDFSFFQQGELYIISAAILSPMLVDFLIQNLEKSLMDRKNHFLSYKTVTLLISFIIIILAIIFSFTYPKSIVIIQLLFYVFSSALSFYMYCVDRLEYRYEEYKYLDDKMYHEKIQEETERTLTKTQSLKLIKNNKGVDIKL